MIFSCTNVCCGKDYAHSDIPKNWIVVCASPADLCAFVLLKCLYISRITDDQEEMSQGFINC